MRRPSASVLSTSIDLPFIAITTSPGLVARPEGIFSQSGIVATTLIGKPNFAIPYKDAETAAPPPMSAFISDIFKGVFNEIPPESNVIPFPTNANKGDDDDDCDKPSPSPSPSSQPSPTPLSPP